MWRQYKGCGLQVDLTLTPSGVCVIEASGLMMADGLAAARRHCARNVPWARAWVLDVRSVVMALDLHTLRETGRQVAPSLALLRPMAIVCLDDVRPMLETYADHCAAGGVTRLCFAGLGAALAWADRAADWPDQHLYVGPLTLHDQSPEYT